MPVWLAWFGFLYKDEKKMLQSWDKEHPGRIETIFRATKSLVPSHLLDESKFDFKGLAKTHAKIPLVELDDT